MFTPFQVILVCVYWWLFTLVSGDIQLINYAAEVFHGLVCGLIMGDVKTGLEVGATMCLMGMGIGASIPVLLSAVGANRDGKRTSMIYLLINVFGTLICTVLFYGIN
ncbi:MAG: PTS sugar transporter subunit IIC, partial [Prevotella sp.]